MSGAILDLAGLVLEVTNLDKAQAFYADLLGLRMLNRDDGRGVLELGFANGQRLSLWKPITRQPNDARLAPLRARGGSHVHYAMQIPKDSRERVCRILREWGLEVQEIDLATEGQEPDIGLYFFDPFGHGLELRPIDPNHPVRPAVPPLPWEGQPVPLLGLREVALAFQDYEAMKTRLAAYGLLFVEELEDRAFAQFILGPAPEKDGQFTPRRWLYCWDPQVGLADMLGGEHATVQFYADLDRLKTELKGVAFLEDDRGIAVRDVEGHVFEFWPLS